MQIHKDDLHAFSDAVGELFDPCVGVMQFAIQDGKICRMKKDGDLIRISTYTGDLGRPDLEPIDLADMAAHFWDWHFFPKPDDLAALQDLGAKCVADLRRDGFMQLCHDIVRYYKKHHGEDTDLIFMNDQAGEFLVAAEAGELEVQESE